VRTGSKKFVRCGLVAKLMSPFPLFAPPKITCEKNTSDVSPAMYGFQFVSKQPVVKVAVQLGFDGSARFGSAGKWVCGALIICAMRLKL